MMFKKMKYVAGGALVLGIVAGVWLSDFLKGIGTGNGIGIGQTGLSGIQTSVGSSPGAEVGMTSEVAAGQAPRSVRIVIKDRQLYLREGVTDTPVSLESLIPMVVAAQGDDDGIKIRIYRTESARVTTELELSDALRAANIPDKAVYTSPDVVPATLDGDTSIDAPPAAR